MCVNGADTVYRVVCKLIFAYACYKQRIDRHRKVECISAQCCQNYFFFHFIYGLVHDTLKKSTYNRSKSNFAIIDCVNVSKASKKAK